MGTRSAGYELFRYYVRFAFWLTHRSVVVTGRRLIPEGKPVIFAPNHQNALMDPLALVCTNANQTVWLARADIFKSKAARPALKFLKLLPVYRIRDGKENLSNNEEIFTRVIGILENKQTVALFPEAAHSGKRQMLPHKKAIPRIALEAEERNNFGLDLQIVPVGIYYSHYWHFNRTLIVQYGEPLSVAGFRDEYAENPQKATISLRDEIYKRLSGLTLQINSSYYQEYENFRSVAGKAYSETRNFSPNPVVQRLEAERDLISKLEYLENMQPELFGELCAKLNAYVEATEQAHWTDERLENLAKTSWPETIFRTAGALATLPVAAAGVAFNVVPFLLPRVGLRRKVKDTAFLSTFYFVVGLVIFPVCYALAAAVVYALTASWLVALGSVVVMPLVGKVAWQLLEFYGRVRREWAFLAGSRSFRNTVGQLLAQRRELVDSVLTKINR